MNITTHNCLFAFMTFKSALSSSRVSSGPKEAITVPPVRLTRCVRGPRVLVCERVMLVTLKELTLMVFVNLRVSVPLLKSISLNWVSSGGLGSMITG